MDRLQIVIKRQRKFYESGATRELGFRNRQLLRLEKAVRENKTAFSMALREDLNKAPFESYATEIGIVLEEIRAMRKRLARLAAPRRVWTPLINLPSVSTVYKEPYGVVLIMSPWNYPFQLTMMPLIGAIAAGNCAVVKPSNASPATSELIARVLGETFPEYYVAVTQGGRSVNRSLLKQKFDYLFFTGSIGVGRTVLHAAAETLTPVTLELGGKSPCIVDETADIRMAARRIVWGKFLNAGQTCVAPDYLLVHRSVKEELIGEMIISIRSMYGDNPLENPDYPRIINRKHFFRLLGLLEGADIAYGGAYDEDGCRIAPTLMEDVGFDDPLMREEIFGPLLPVLVYDRLAEAAAKVKALPRPLALYHFTSSRRYERYIREHLTYGGGCVNDTIMHLSNSGLPFGGVGDSGMGRYHGKASFDTFTHEKGILKKSCKIDIPLRYPPYRNHLPLLEKCLH